jgi:squalene synthase HpnC
MGVVMEQGVGPTLARSRRRERAENFPVAMRLLPREPRRHLHAVYAVARLIDDAGDDPDRSTTQRMAQLDMLESDLLGIWAGEVPVTPELRALMPTVAQCGLGAEPFTRLIAANRLDQTTTTYATFDELRDYCTLSADPIGRIVLAIARASEHINVALSDNICTALQILEHCQDLGEDWRLRGRVYLPQQDMQPFGVTATALEAGHAGAGVRALVEFETDRAAGLLTAGAPLVGRLHGWARLAVAGYVAGGLATIDAFARAGYDVLAATVRPHSADVARQAVRLLVRGR